MPVKNQNLHGAIKDLGRAIRALDAGNSQSIIEVRNSYAVVVQTATVVEQHTDRLTAAIGFDCSPPSHIPIPD